MLNSSELAARTCKSDEKRNKIKIYPKEEVNRYQEERKT